MAYLLHHAQQQNVGEKTIGALQSHSGDIDIPVILLANEVENLRVYIDNGAGQHRKFLDLSSCDLLHIQKQALLGVHAFSGNDYISSLMRKGKKACWNLVKENSEFLAAFSEIGTEETASDNLVNTLERCVCQLYGEKSLASANKVLKKIMHP